MTGPWHILIYDDHLLIRQNDTENYIPWEQVAGTVEFEDLYLIYSKNGNGLFFLFLPLP